MSVLLMLTLQHEGFLQLEQGFHADMDYMQSHGMMRARPDELYRAP